MSIPRDFVAEIEDELDVARRRIRCESAHRSALEELHELAVSVSRELRRPITVFDVFAAAADDAQRRHFAALVTELRRPDSAR